MEINKSVKINIDAYNIFVLKFFFLVKMTIDIKIYDYAACVKCIFIYTEIKFKKRKQQPHSFTELRFILAPFSS